MSAATTTPTLHPGERHAGIVLDAAGQYQHHLILLPARPDKRAPWRKQMDWAASVGGDLPSPQEQALLFANCRDALPKAWCWSNKEHEADASYAWFCYFVYGGQGYDLKSFEGSAVAVRRLVLDSFNPFGAAAGPRAQACTAIQDQTLDHFVANLNPDSDHLTSELMALLGTAISERDLHAALRRHGFTQHKVRQPYTNNRAWCWTKQTDRAHACTQAPAGTFTHTHRPAYVSKGEYSNQRRYGPTEGEHLPAPVIAATDREKGEFTVYRDAENDLAEVRLAIGNYSSASLRLRMTPAELREAAARLLDAAHDIEVNPSDVLQRHAQEGGAA